MIRPTKHAREAVGARNIALAWLEAAVTSLDFVEADRRHPERKRSYKAITEHDGCVLRLCIEERRRYRDHHSAF
jgi:hypothetical protein